MRTRARTRLIPVGVRGTHRETGGGEATPQPPSPYMARFASRAVLGLLVLLSAPAVLAQSAVDSATDYLRQNATAVGLAPADLADLVVAEVVYDDGEEEERTPTPDGVLQVFGLALGDGNAWRVEDLWVGTPPEGVFLDDGRFLPSDVPVGSGPVEVRLGLDDGAPWGLRIEQTRPPEGATRLDLDLLVTQEVLRSELVGTWRAVVVP